MGSSSGQSRSSARKTQWWLVAVLLAGAAALGGFGVLPVPASVMAAAGAVWGSVLLATDPWVVGRIPNTRGAIVLTGVVIAVGLTFFAFNTAHLKGHAHAMEHTASSPP
jgi:hypothetical protein